MKRLLTLIVLALAAALAVTLAAGGTGVASSGGGKRIDVFERATTYAEPSGAGSGLALGIALGARDIAAPAFPGGGERDLSGGGKLDLGEGQPVGLVLGAGGGGQGSGQAGVIEGRLAGAADCDFAWCERPAAQPGRHIRRTRRA